MNWDDWRNMKAADRIEIHGQVADAFDKKEGKVNLFSVIHDFPQHLDLLRELAFGESVRCECCDESCPEVMIYEGALVDDEWKDGIEADIVGDYEWAVCAWCVQNKREETTCVSCGCSRWNTHTWVQNEAGDRVQMPTPCTNPDGHLMQLKHPYKEASQ